LYKYGIANVLLRDDDIRVKKKENHITLSTIHKSKGLEYNIVIAPHLDLLDDLKKYLYKKTYK
jgi:ATP-dependent exoDNAse (exonuclease V) beta subunit